MYFDPYVLGLVMGALGTLALELLILFVSGIISVNRKRRNRR